MPRTPALVVPQLEPDPVDLVRERRLVWAQRLGQGVELLARCAELRVVEVDETYDDIEEFEDGIKDVPLSIDRLMNDDSIPFKIMEKTNDEQVERRIHHDAGASGACDRGR